MYKWDIPIIPQNPINVHPIISHKMVDMMMALVVQKMAMAEGAEWRVANLVMTNIAMERSTIYGWFTY